tara:strand:+ start:3255 stop:4637 length:1383 start_codon:yes stop_codon:yes gene_type:complete
MEQDNICALATASGVGAISVLRVSGPDAIDICSSIFESKQSEKQLTLEKSHTIHLGYIVNGNQMIDEVLVSIFKGPSSYTGENTIEISCHGSIYIQQQILQLLIHNGCRMARAGEFTFRAFMNGKMDLSQAEAVADLISSSNEKSHQLALSQMRGGFSSEINSLRKKLIKFTSLIELELDFSSEDVEFANRNDLTNLIDELKLVLRKLIDSFALGNVLKNGIPVAIVGEPNVGKSTLLNTLLNDDRAIVSEIAGTTRDTVEDELIIDGTSFRFIDTAGIRATEEKIERIGIKKTYQKIAEAKVVLYLFDSLSSSPTIVKKELSKLQKHTEYKHLIVLANKVDGGDLSRIKMEFDFLPQILFISAKSNIGVEALKSMLIKKVMNGMLSNNDLMVSNTRHYEALSNSLNHVSRVQEGMIANISGDLLAMDLRQALYHLGQITGEITTDDLLDSIFNDFCIGK